MRDLGTYCMNAQLHVNKWSSNRGWDASDTGQHLILMGILSTQRCHQKKNYFYWQRGQTASFACLYLSKCELCNCVFLNYFSTFACTVDKLKMNIWSPLPERLHQLDGKSHDTFPPCQPHESRIPGNCVPSPQKWAGSGEATPSPRGQNRLLIMRKSQGVRPRSTYHTSTVGISTHV